MQSGKYQVTMNELLLVMIINQNDLSTYLDTKFKYISIQKLFRTNCTLQMFVKHIRFKIKAIDNCNCVPYMGCNSLGGPKRIFWGKRVQN